MTWRLNIQKLKVRIVRFRGSDNNNQNLLDMLISKMKNFTFEGGCMICSNPFHDGEILLQNRKGELYHKSCLSDLNNEDKSRCMNIDSR